MKKLISAILCIFISSSAIAAPKVSNLRQGQKAPFAGVLLDPEALATIQADKDSLEKKCSLEKALEEEKFKLNLQIEKDTCLLQKDIINKQFQIQLQEKELKIKLLDEKISKLKPVNNGLWIGIGAGIGLIIGASAAIIIEKKF